MKITRKRLIDSDLCPRWIAMFYKMWPNGCMPTVDNMFLAAAHGFPVHWLAELLSPSTMEIWESKYRHDVSVFHYHAFIPEMSDRVAAAITELADLLYHEDYIPYSERSHSCS